MKRLLFSLLALCLAVAGYSQQIRNLDETVVLREDGSARITQIWDVNIVSGTEFYLPFDGLGPMEIFDLTVSENGEPFLSEGFGWDTDRTRDEKRGRCGIVRKHDGVELCWGQGDYGDHRWEVSYTVKGLAMKMGEWNGLFFTFVNPGLAAPPEHVKLMLVNGTGGPAWTSDNVKVWGFRSDSEIFVEDGAIRAESLSAFGRNSAMTLLVRFAPDLFTPAITYEKSFEEVQEAALEGSDYLEDSSGKITFYDILASAFMVVLFLFSPAGIAILAFLLYLYMLFTYHVLGLKYKKSLYGKQKIQGWYRDLPLEGNIPAAYYALTKGDRLDRGQYANNLIGAYFLRWVLDGFVTVLPDPKDANRVNLSFKRKAHFPEAVENDLYQMVREASGNNLILEKNEFEKWSKKSFKRVSNIPEREQTQGQKWFQDHHLLIKKDHCNPAGQQEACHLIEFKNFLQDFTLSEERGAIEVSVWRDYLVYAALFGIADKVARQFQKLYPAQFQELTGTAQLNTASFYNMMRISDHISATAMRNAVQEQSLHGGGKRSGGGGWSGGGGGGFSMGGGGGSFGGSFGGGSR